MSTTATATVPEGTLVTLESPDERRRRIRLGSVLLTLAVIGGGLALTTKSDTVRFAFDTNSLGLPAKPVALALSAAALVIAISQLVKGLRGKSGTLLFSLFGLAFIVTFLSWAASGDTFQMTNQLQGTLNTATPLIFGALAGVLCERAGVINIAIEGQFLAGAFAAAVLATVSGSVFVGVLGAIFAGVLIASMLAVFSIRYTVNQVVLGVVLVVFATGLTGFLFDQLIQEDPTAFNSPAVLAPLEIPVLSDIPVIGTILFAQTALVYTMYVAVAVVMFVLFKTRWGLRVRSVGEHPRAADTVGINVLRMRYQAVLLGGVFAGLGGAFFTVGYGGSFNKEMTAGNGFIALAAVIMGRWHPLGAAFAALFFGFTTQLQSQLQILSTPIPGELLLMAPYVVTVVAVAGLVGRVRAPKADGEPYVKE